MCNVVVSVQTCAMHFAVWMCIWSWRAGSSVYPFLYKQESEIRKEKKSPVFACPDQSSSCHLWATVDLLGPYCLATCCLAQDWNRLHQYFGHYFFLFYHFVLFSSNMFSIFYLSVRALQVSGCSRLILVELLFDGLSNFPI